MPLNKTSELLIFPHNSWLISLDSYSFKRIIPKVEICLKAEKSLSVSTSKNNHTWIKIFETKIVGLQIAYLPPPSASIKPKSCYQSSV